MSNIKMKLIAAACENMGIGMNNTLPWKLKLEMKYFERMTTDTKDNDKQNAVIMGHKTWLSIPQKFRPLKNRINIVLSRQRLEGTDYEGASYIAGSLDDALNYIQEPQMQNRVESVWVTGGEQIYKIAMESLYCEYIYLTRIKAYYPCDTFFPAIPQDKFALTSDPSVPEEMQNENGTEYRFEVYKRR